MAACAFPLSLLTTTLLPLLLMALPAAWAHTYHMGSCPQLPPMKGFVTSKFLGRWHVLQKTSTRVRCLTNQYAWASGGGGGGSKGAARGEWADEQEEGGDVALLQRMQLPVPGINNALRYAGALRKDPDPARAGAFKARFPLNVLGSATYVVFDTDYDTYAGVYSCQNIMLWHRLSASIMTRGKSLDAPTVQKLRNQLKAYGINVKDLDEIRHTCDENAEEQGIQVHIKPNVFRTNATDILQDANDVVGSAADAAKRVHQIYNTVNTVYTGVASAAGAARRRRDVRPPLRRLDSKPDPLETDVVQGDGARRRTGAKPQHPTQRVFDNNVEVAQGAYPEPSADAEAMAEQLLRDWMP